MDPLTLSVRAFCQELRDGWDLGAKVGIVAAPEQHGRLIQALRLFEWAPENRWPVCVLAGSTSQGPGRVRAAFEALQRGLAADGVAVADPEGRGGGLREELERCGAAAAASGAVDGLAAVLIPAAEALAQVVAEVSQWPASERVRIAVAGADAGVLAALPERATLAIDEEAWWRFCQAQAERAAAAAPPAEARARRALLAASAAVRGGELLPARAAYEEAVAALEAMGRAEAAGITELALGGVCLSLGDASAALTSFDRAAALPATAPYGHLGAAGVLYSRGELEAAGRRYEAAVAGAPAALQIEAWWMRGSCWAELGEEERAAAAWEAALAAGAEVPAEVRRRGSWSRAAEALRARCQTRGETRRAAELEAALAQEGGC